MTELEQILFEALDNHRAAMHACVDAEGRTGCPWRPSRSDVAGFSAQHREHVVRDVVAPLVIEHATTPSPGNPAPAGHDRKA